MPRLRLAPLCSHARFRVAVAELGVVRRLHPSPVNESHKHFLRDYGHLLKEQALDAKATAEAANSDEQDFRAGCCMGFYSALSLLHQQATAFQIPLEELSLADFSPEDVLTKATQR